MYRTSRKKRTRSQRTSRNNRLNGTDSIVKRSELVKRLSEKLDTKALASMLPESVKDIERLKAIAGKMTKPLVRHTAMLNCMVFFLDDEQNRIVEEALKEAIDPGEKGTRAQKKAWGIVSILREAKSSKNANYE